jgi:hypothetical protein
MARCDCQQCEAFRRAVASDPKPALPVDVVRLVIAARRALDLGYSDEEFGELEQALEAFSDRVPYDP